MPDCDSVVLQSWEPLILLSAIIYLSLCTLLLELISLKSDSKFATPIFLIVSELVNSLTCQGSSNDFNNFNILNLIFTLISRLLLLWFLPLKESINQSIHILRDFLNIEIQPSFFQRLLIREVICIRKVEISLLLTIRVHHTL